MTIEEAKKAGFRIDAEGWATTWRILNTNEIRRLYSKVRGLDAKDFPTRAKAREALRKPKAEAEPLEWCEYNEGSRLSPESFISFDDGKTWTTVTGKFIGVCYSERLGIRARYRNPLWLAKHGKSVESHETPVGETQAKEVVTDETQNTEPVKCIMDGDEFCGITPEWKAWKERQDAKTKPETPKPTTVRGWLETIPDQAIRDAAIRQCEEWSKNCTNLPDSILNIWNWDLTSEGVEFWNRCYDAAYDGTPWPPYPPKAKQEADGWTQEEIDKAAFKCDAGNKYHRTIHGVSGGSLVVDVYNVLDAFGVTCPACQHAIKKLLCAGLRNKGSRLQDLSEAAESASRAVTLEKQRS